MERKSSKENSVVFLVEGEEFKLRICVGGVGSAANSVGTMLKFTAFGAVLTPNLAELALSVFFSIFFCSAVVRTHFPRKNTHVYVN